MNELNVISPFEEFMAAEILEGLTLLFGVGDEKVNPGSKGMGIGFNGGL